MPDLYILAEGKGEQGFVEADLAAHLAPLKVWAHGVLVGKPAHKGGVRSWESVRTEITRFLKMDRPARPIFVSTLFDYYHMPHTWPARAAAAALPHPRKTRAIQDAMAADIAALMGAAFQPNRFIPNVQIHELESLIFAQPETLAAEFPDRQTEVQQLCASIAGLEPEQINDHPNSAPSVRIKNHIPEYEKRKASAAVSVLSAIGLPTLRARCPHFAQWLSALENLGH